MANGTPPPDATAVLAQFRARFPQYKDVPDDRLAQGIVQRFPQYGEALKGVLPPPAPPAPDVGGQLQRGVEIGAPTVGSMAGGFAGQALAGRPGAVLGAGVGGAAGAVAAEMTRPLLAPSAPPATLMEKASRVLEEGALAAGTEAVVPLVGNLAMRGLRKGLIGVSKPSLIAPEVQAARQALHRVGGELSVGQLTGRGLALGDIFEGAAEGAILGSGRYARFRGMQEGWLQGLTDDLVQHIGGRLSNANLSALTKDILDKKIDAFYKVQRSLYNRVDALAPNAGVRTQDIIDFFERNSGNLKVKDLMGAVLPEGASAKLMTLVPTQTGSVQVAKAPFGEVAEFRSRVLALSRRKESGAPLADVGTIRLAKKLSKVVNDAIDTSATNLPPEALEAWRFANQVTDEGHDTFTSKLINSFYKKVRDNPSNFSHYLLNSSSTDTLEALKGAVGPEQFQRIQQRMAGALIERAAEGPTGPNATRLVTAQGLRGAIKGLGSDVAGVAFTPEMRTGFQQLINALEVGAAKVGGPGRVAMALMQPAAAVEVAAGFTGEGPVRKAAWTILLGPAVVGRLFTSPRVVRMLADGIKAGPGTDALRRAISELTVFGALEATKPQTEPAATP